MWKPSMNSWSPRSFAIWALAYRSIQTKRILPFFKSLTLQSLDSTTNWSVLAPMEETFSSPQQNLYEVFKNRIDTKWPWPADGCCLSANWARPRESSRLSLSLSLPTPLTELQKTSEQSDNLGLLQLHCTEAQWGIFGPKMLWAKPGEKAYGFGLDWWNYRDGEISCLDSSRP